LRAGRKQRKGHISLRYPGPILVADLVCDLVAGLVCDLIADQACDLVADLLASWCHKLDNVMKFGRELVCDLLASWTA